MHPGPGFIVYYPEIESQNIKPDLMTKFFLYCFFSLVFFNGTAQQNNSKPFVWTLKKKQQHYKYRNDLTKWSRKNLAVDLKNLDSKKDEPFKEGVFPVPQYDLVAKKSFNGLGNMGSYKGIAFKNKTLVYNSFYVSKCLINQEYIPNKVNEVFFTIITLTDYIDKENYSHMDALVTSRNHPDYMAQGYFKTKKNIIEFVSFLTADRHSYAIVNMRLFDLNLGKVILIAPQKDGSFRSMQLSAPTLSSKEIKSFVQQTLKRKKVIDFFTRKGNI